MTAAESAQRRALAAGLLLVLVWGASFSIQKAAYAAMGPGAFLFCRSLLMALCALALLRWRGSPLWPRLSRRDSGLLLGCTAIGPVLHVLLVTYGIHWSTPFSSALIMACGPVCTLILLRVLRGTPLRRNQMLGVGVAFAGVLLFMSEKLMHAAWRASGGDLLMLVSALAFSLYTIAVTPLIERYGGPEVLCWTTLLAAPVLLVLNAPAAWVAPYAALSAAMWSAVLWSVLISAFLGWMLWGWVNAVRGVARTAPLMYGVPPVAGLVAWFTVGEGYGGLKLAGAALALGGVAWTQLRTDHP